MRPADKLRFFRLLSGYSQADMAHAINTTQPYYAQVEAGKTLSLQHAQIFAQKMSLNKNWLLDNLEFYSVFKTKPFLNVEDGNFYYCSIPSPELKNATLRVKNRLISECATALIDHLQQFLKENGMKSCHTLSTSNESCFYLFEMGPKIWMIIKTENKFLTDTMKEVLCEISKTNFTRDAEVGSQKTTTELDDLRLLLETSRKFSEEVLLKAPTVIVKEISKFAKKVHEEAKLAAVRKLCDEIIRLEINIHTIHEEMVNRNRSDLLLPPFDPATDHTAVHDVIEAAGFSSSLSK